MPTYNALETQEKETVETFDRNLRGAMGSLQRVMNTLEGLKVTYIAQVNSIVTTLNAGEDIPDTSGLAGSVPLDYDTEWSALITDLNNLLTTYNSDARKQIRDKAAGFENTQGNG